MLQDAVNAATGSENHGRHDSQAEVAMESEVKAENDT